MKTIRYPSCPVPFSSIHLILLFPADSLGDGSLGLAERLSTFLWMQHFGTFSRVMRSFLLSLSVVCPHPQGFNDHQGLAVEQRRSGRNDAYYYQVYEIDIVRPKKIAGALTFRGL